MSKIEAILFDLGETVLNFGRVDAAGLFKQGGRLAYDFLKNLSQPVGNFRLFLAEHLIFVRLYQFWSNIIKRDFDSLQLLKKMQIKKGIQLSPAQWEQFAWCWYEPLAKIASIEPDIADTLAGFKQAGLKLAIVSNTFIDASTLDRHLAQLGLLNFFDARVYSYQYNFRKPDKRIFQAAIEQLLVKPENVLVVGDRLDTDIKGAAAAGMTAVLKNAYTNEKKKKPKNVLQIKNLAELGDVIKKIDSAENMQIKEQ